MSTSMEHLA